MNVPASHSNCCRGYTYTRIVQSSQAMHALPTLLPTEGNKETLMSLPSSRGQDVRKELLQFHSTYYSSNVMALAVLGKGKICCKVIKCHKGGILQRDLVDI